MGLIKGLKMLVDNIEFMTKLMDHKMLTVKAEENVIRLFPPLIVNNKELDEAASKIEKVCERPTHIGQFDRKIRIGVKKQSLWRKVPTCIVFPWKSTQVFVKNTHRRGSLIPVYPAVPPGCKQRYGQQARSQYSHIQIFYY